MGFLAALAINAQDAAAEVEADIKYIFYPVKPEPGRSLYAQIFKDTPLRHKDRPVAAITDWNIKYERTYARTSPNLCDIKTYRVTYTCAITLPRLESDDAGLISDFNVYWPLLKEHELTHCRIAADYARQLEGHIKSLGRQKCGDLDKALKAARNQAITEAKTAHRSFDRATLARKRNFNHGKMLLGDSYLTGDSPPAEAPVGPGPSTDGGAPGDEFYRDSDGVWKNY